MTIFLFIVFTIRLWNRDFYYDEIVTIDNFLLCPLIDVITKYVNLNNHFLYSVIMNVYLQLIGVGSIGQVLDNPWILRVPQLIFPLLTIWLVYRFCYKHFNEEAAFCGMLLIVTTLPFYYYSVAIRGYGLSICLMAATFTCLIEKKYSLFILFSTLFMYVMPSNIIFMVGVGIVYMVSWVITRNEFYNDGVFALMLSFGFVVLLYLPVISGILSDTQIQAHNAGRLIVTQSLPEIVNSFISYRWLLLLFIIPCFKGNVFLWKVAGVTTVAFLLFIISGNYLYARVFFPMLPLWCMGLVANVQRRK